MKQLQIIEPGRSVLNDVPVPTPGDGEAIVRVSGISTCPQWDLHIMGGIPMFEGMDLKYPYWPGQPGHEMTGTVHSVGEGVTDLDSGATVAVWRDAGPYRQGAYGEYACVRAENLLVVPAALEVSEIASLELAMCVQVSFDQIAPVSGLEGAKLGLTGMGPAGLIAVQIGKAMGAHVVAYDPVASRRSLAEKLGADEAIDPGQESRSDRFLDYSIDLTGAVPAITFLIERTIQAVTLFGVLRDYVGFGASHWYGGFSLIGYGEHNIHAARRALEHIVKGDLKLAPLISRVMHLSQYEEGVRLLKEKEAIKILFKP